MGINALDIKIRKSQRLTDNPDGGGRMVAAEVVDGELNNLFPDISTQDRVAGRVSMRKAFVHVDTANVDLLYGAVGVVMEAPADDSVGMTMFSTGNYADQRGDARNRIESYITKGVESRFILFGDHFIGQRAVTVYCMKDAPTPEVNQTYALSVEKTGYTANVQYVRVQEVVSRTTQTFIDDSGAFDRDVVVFNTTTALLYDFVGQEASRFTSAKPPTRVRQTNVADASSYYGIKPLALAAAIGDLVVNVGSPYAALVPATQAETPVVDVVAGMGAISLVQSGANDSLVQSFSTAFSAGVAVARYLGSPLVKGAVTVTVAGTTLVDDGRGALVAGGASQWGGSVDYLGGVVFVTSTTAVTGASTVTITATPAGAVSMQGYTTQIEVGPQNRQSNYVLQIGPLPGAGTVTLDYRALGKWIRLVDSGAGQLAGSPGQGSGTVNYQTGSVTVTLGALPDLGSAIIVAFGTGVQTARRDGDAAIAAPALDLVLSNAGITPSTLTVSWLVGGVTVSASDDGAGVMKIGTDVVGAVTYATGEVSVRPPTLPDAGSQIAAAYSWAPVQSATFTPAVNPGSGLASLDLGGAVRAGAVRFQWVGSMAVGTTATGYVVQPVSIVVVDDGVGGLVAVSAGGAAFSASLGAIDYATGVATLQVSAIQLAASVPQYLGRRDSNNQLTDWGLRDYLVTQNIVTAASGTPVSATWQAAGAVDTAATDDQALPPVGFDLTPAVVDSVVAGSVRFDFRGRTYIDRSGSLYFAVSPTSGAGTYAGTVDYTTGRVRISDWAAGGSNTIAVTSLLSRFTEAGTAQVYFRTPGSPLRAGSFTLRATTLGGDLLTAAADFNGAISGAGVEGEIDWQSGAVSVRFGEMVAAAGNEAEAWYHPDAVVGGMIWRPALVLPETVFFGTVVYRSIPLNPAILGLDPVRLPEDGRVVIFKPGQTVLVHHTQTTSVASPAPGQVVDFGRPDLSRVEVRDSAGVAVDSIWTTIDKAAGTLTFSDPLNLAAYALPIVIRDRIEDRVLCADAQITGEVAINRALAHDYPLGSSLSTCLILGEANGSQDLQARVENLFDQQTWTAVFSEARIGSGTDAQYNDVVYPLQVDNGNAITERWALHFTSSSVFEIIGEASGIIGTGDTATDCTPLNPRTGLPYFTVPAAGWGIGWGVGNVLRFNTIGGLAPVWFIRTTLAGDAELPVDGFRFEAIGDANP